MQSGILPRVLHPGAMALAILLSSIASGPRSAAAETVTYIIGANVRKRRFDTAKLLAPLERRGVDARGGAVDGAAEG